VYVIVRNVIEGEGDVYMCEEVLQGRGGWRLVRANSDVIYT
jgi:hypothetical protein